MEEVRSYLAAGVRLSCIDAGPEDGPLVILLHGFPEDALSWRVQIDALAAAGYRVLAPDQRGYGASDKPKGVAAYGIDRLADDVVALAAALGRTQFDLVGHDWGGAVAWWVATRHAGPVRRLVILNAPHPVAMGPYLRRSPSQRRHSAYIGLFQLPAIPEAMLRAVNFALLARVLRRSSRPGAFSDVELTRLRQVWAQPGALTAMLNWYRGLKQTPRSVRKGRVQAPTLLLWGMLDAFLEPGLAQASADLCDNVRRRDFDAATHWVHHEEGPAVAASITAFLKACSPAPPPGVQAPGG